MVQGAFKQAFSSFSSGYFEDGGNKTTFLDRFLDISLNNNLMTIGLISP